MELSNHKQKQSVQIFIFIFQIKIKEKKKKPIQVWSSHELCTLCVAQQPCFDQYSHSHLLFM